MIYEMRTYTLKPGMHALVAKNAGEVGRAIRGDDYGKLEGYWITEIGPLNQVMHLWRYEGLDERQRLREALSENEAWTGEYLPLIRPHLVRQDIRLMHAFLPLKAPETSGNVYEYRHYRTVPGKAREFAKHFEAAMPVREKYSKNVCAWVTEAGQPNEVSHLWPIRASTREPKCAERPCRTRIGKRFSGRGARSSRKCIRASSCPPRTRPSSRSRPPGNPVVEAPTSRFAGKPAPTNRKPPDGARADGDECNLSLPVKTDPASQKKVDRFLASRMF